MVLIADGFGYIRVEVLRGSQWVSCKIGSLGNEVGSFFPRDEIVNSPRV